MMKQDGSSEEIAVSQESPAVSVVVCSVSCGGSS